MFTIKRGDTRTPLYVELSNHNGVIDLTNCTVRFFMSKDNQTYVNGLAEITDAPNGRVWYVFQPDDTAVLGMYKAEFRVEYPDFKVDTFPSDDYIKVHVLNNLGGS